MRWAGLRTLAAVFVTLAAVVGGGFALQVAVLGRPSSTSLLVARVAFKLVQYHRSRSTITINGKHLSAVCTQQWQGRHRVAVVRLDNGQILREIGNKLSQAGSLAIDEFDLAGCPRPLIKWLGDQLDTGKSIDVRPLRIDGKPVYAVSFPSSEPKLSLVVTRPGGLPTMLSITGGDIRATARVSYGTRPDAQRS